MSTPTWVKLVVGGECFETSRSTLEQLEYFRVRFNHGWQGELRLDRDPKAFRALLNHLRDPRYELPSKYWPELKFFNPAALPLGPEPEPEPEPDEALQVEQLPSVETASDHALLPVLANAGSELLDYILPHCTSRLITPIDASLPLQWPFRGAMQLAVSSRVSFDLRTLAAHLDLLTGLELHFRGQGAHSAVRSLSLYRAEQLASRLEQPAVQALHELFDGRRHAMRLLDLFGRAESALQSRCLCVDSFAQTEHFADCCLLRWELELDTDLVEELWLVVTGRQELFKHDPQFALDYQFNMFPVMAQQWIEAAGADERTVPLRYRRGLLSGLIVLLLRGNERRRVARLEVRANGRLIHAQLGGEQQNNIYWLQFGGELDVRRCDALVLQLVLCSDMTEDCHLLVIGAQRHFNFARFGWPEERFPTTTFA